ncbi:12412_t:CDS:2 [Gigaspora margarita]|uniref:12412_t:CDS:1 n=1 Tax=Gigaspora margarita TaxID=4874 RepID=A0ABM8W2M7_GIGMA|nr:12412_t:CDS:2 [Gigaspora margarita]
MNCHKFFDIDNDYIILKKKIEALQLASDEEHIEIAINLSCPALESPVNNPEFYKKFLKAEEIFHQLPDDIS